jgi:hypothetical protein
MEISDEKESQMSTIRTNFFLETKTSKLLRLANILDLGLADQEFIQMRDSLLSLRDFTDKIFAQFRAALFIHLHYLGFSPVKSLDGIFDLPVLIKEIEDFYKLDHSNSIC